MKAHKHAALMAEYAKDAAETETPWKRWEFFYGTVWHECSTAMSWDECTQYRRKPRTININGFEVPEPMREAPEVGTAFYVPNLSEPDNPNKSGWHQCYLKQGWLCSGLAHASREAAVIHAEALLSFTARERKEGA